MHIFIRKLSTASQLPLQSWVVLFKSWVMLFYIRLRMNLTPFRSWKHWLVQEPGKTPEPLTKHEELRVATYRRMITLASRYHLINANCLPKSLTLKWMLEKDNIYTELKMGLNLDNKTFHGHAWLQRNNVVLNDSDDVTIRYPVKQEINQKPLGN